MMVCDGGGNGLDGQAAVWHQWQCGGLGQPWPSSPFCPPGTAAMAASLAADSHQGRRAPGAAGADGQREPMDGMSKLRDPSAADVPETGMVPWLCWEAWVVAAALHGGRAEVHPWCPLGSMILSLEGSCLEQGGTRWHVEGPAFPTRGTANGCCLWAHVTLTLTVLPLPLPSWGVWWARAVERKGGDAAPSLMRPFAGAPQALAALHSLPFQRLSYPVQSLGSTGPSN